MSDSKPFSVRAHDGGLTAMKFDPLGRSLATCGSDLMCRIWLEMDEYWMCNHEIDLDSETTALCWSPYVGHGEYALLLAVGSNCGTMSIWLLNDYDRPLPATCVNEDKTIETDPKLVHTVRCHPYHPVTCLAIHPKGNIIAVGSSKANGVNLWSLNHGMLVNTINGHGGVNDFTWIGESALAACFNRSEVILES